MTYMFRLLGTLCCILSLFSCSNEAEDAFAHIPAFFRFSPVSSAQPLHGALNSPGEYCIITIDARNFIFTDKEGRSIARPRSAMDAYGQPECIRGFVVGTPFSPDLNNEFHPLAYELACPACYEFHTKSIAMQFSRKHLNAMECPRCHRTYDMSMQGTIIEGDEGPRMYRYRHLLYNNDTMIIQN